MKILRLGRIFLIVLSLVIPSSLHSFFGKTFISPRSASVNAALELVGWQELINRFDVDHNYWAFAITPEYVRSYDRGILNQLFGGCNTFVFSGSQAASRGKNDILSDYFGMPLDFKSAVCVRPVTSTFLIDFDFYYGLENFVQGLYFKIHAPIVQTNWNLHFEECISFKGKQGYPAGYMAPTALATSQLPTSIEDVFEGKTTFGDMQEPLKYGKIFGREDLVHISDVQFIVGWNFAEDEQYHVGFNGRISAPTGSKYCAGFLFNPIIGNGQRWELGVGFTTHWLRDDLSDWYDIGFYLDANVSHLFATTQCRSYDLKHNCPGSRYMLIEQIIQKSTNLFVDGAATPNQYATHLFPAINKTTLLTKTRVNVQLDIAAKLTWRSGNWDIDLGYDLWFRSAEKIMCRQHLPSNTYALKGDAQIYGFAGGTPIPLNATESKATIRGGQGTGNFVAGSVLQNLNVDSPAQAQGPVLGNDLVNGSGLLVDTSNPAILLSDRDINESSGIACHALSQKIFGHIGYSWYKEDAPYVPFLGVGAEVECVSHTKKGENSAVPQWGIWVKGGFAT